MLKVNLCQEALNLAFDAAEMGIWKPMTAPFMEKEMVRTVPGADLPLVARIHVMNCLCYRDKPPAMGYAEGGADPGCVMLRDTLTGLLSDVHLAWLALADSDIDEADRLLIKWVEVYRQKPPQ